MARPGDDLAYGSLPVKPEHQGDDPIRPWISFHQSHVNIVSQHNQSGGIQEPQRQLPRQRSDRKVPPLPEVGRIRGHKDQVRSVAKLPAPRADTRETPADRERWP
jgi:hypothetical protein